MKKALITILAILATLLVFVSCENSIDDMFNPQPTPEPVNGVWAIGSNYYETLQEAVNAVPKGTKELSYTEIRLLKNAEGPGAVIDGGAVKLNFADYSFTFTGVSGAYDDEDASYGLEITGGANVVIENPSDRAVTIEGGESTSDRAMIMVSGNGSKLTLKGKTNLSVADNQYVFYAKDGAELFAGSEDPDPEVLVKLNGKLAATETNNVVITGNTNVKTEEITLSGTSKVTLSTEKSGDVGIVEIGTITGSTGTAKVRIESKTAGTVIINNDSPYEYAGEGTEGDVVKTQSYTITYVLDEGCTIEDETYATVYKADGTSATTALPTNVTNTDGSTFGGWYYDKDLTQLTGGSIASTETGDKTLYAKWNAVYTVTFDGNGATEGEMSAESFIDGESKALTLNAFGRTGYVFDGWATSASGAKAYNNEEVVTITEDTTLYARWNPITYKVRFNANGGSGEMADQTFTYGISQNLTTNSFTAPTAKNFGGWATTPGGSVAYSNEALITDPLSSTQDAVYNLYATWVDNVYTVVYYGNGYTGGAVPGSNEVEVGQEATIAEKGTLAKTGYSFSSWNTEANGSGEPYEAGDHVSFVASPGDVINLYAQWDANTITISFNPRGGDNTPSDTTVTYGEAYGADIANASAGDRAGFTIDAWYTDETAGNKIESDTTVTTTSTNQTLYAHWLYTISYDANGAGTGSAPASQTNLLEGSSVTLETNTGSLAKIGYTFDGWNTNPEGGSETHYDEGDVLSTGIAAGNTTLYADWTANSYTVVFNANNGTEDTANQNFVYNTAQNLNANSFERTGYSFTHWTESPEDSEPYYSDEEEVNNLTTTKDGTFNLYAQWSPITYTVVFHANNGTEDTAEQEYTYDAAQNLNSNTFTEPEGKVFFGWTTNSNGTGDFYEDGQSVSNLTAVQGEVVNLYAQWADTNYVGKVVTSKASGSEKLITSVYYGQTAASLASSSVKYRFYYSNDNGASFTELLTVDAKSIVSGHGYQNGSTAMAINNALQSEVAAERASASSVIYYSVFVPEGDTYEANNNGYASFYMYIPGDSGVQVAAGSVGSAFTTVSLSVTSLRRDNTTGGSVPSNLNPDTDPTNLYMGKTKFLTGRSLQTRLDMSLTEQTRSNYYVNGTDGIYTVWQLRQNANAYEGGMYHDWFVPSIGELKPLRDTFGAIQDQSSSPTYPDRNKDYFGKAIYGSIYNAARAVVTYSSSFKDNSNAWAWNNYETTDAASSFGRNSGSNEFRACVLVRTF